MGPAIHGLYGKRILFTSACWGGAARAGFCFLSLAEHGAKASARYERSDEAILFFFLYMRIWLRMQGHMGGCWRFFQEGVAMHMHCKVTAGMYLF
jgi:hypothetical protein